MGRPAFHPPSGAKGEGKGAWSRAREGSEGGQGIEVGSVGSQPCAPTASLVMLFALSLSSPLSPLSLLSLLLFLRLSPLLFLRTVPYSFCDVSHVTFFCADGVRYIFHIFTCLFASFFPQTAVSIRRYEYSSGCKILTLPPSPSAAR